MQWRPWDTSAKTYLVILADDQLDFLYKNFSPLRTYAIAFDKVAHAGRIFFEILKF